MHGSSIRYPEACMKKIVCALIVCTSIGVSLPTFASEPSLHDVYQAAGSGKVDDAQRMMHEVLKAHPNSGKAHYVEAELLVKQGQLKQAANELETAEKLAPGLPFATGQSVARLRESLVSRKVTATGLPVQHEMSPAPSARNSNAPWGILFLGLGLVAFIAWATKFMGRRNSLNNGVATQSDFGGYRPAAPSMANGGVAQAYGPTGVPPIAGQGLGSQLLGGLATGAAVGAGVAAGEALMHRFMDGHQSAPGSAQAFSSFDSIPSLPSTPMDDMGGNDFGIADNSSWDDAASSASSDWN